MIKLFLFLAVWSNVSFAANNNWRAKDVLRYPMMSLFPKNLPHPDFSTQDVGEPLYLTPLLRGGRIKEAQKRARVKGLSVIPSYTGFMTVNKKYNSNLFFWYIPAAVRISLVLIVRYIW